MRICMWILIDILRIMFICWKINFILNVLSVLYLYKKFSFVSDIKNIYLCWFIDKEKEEKYLEVVLVFKGGF